MSRAWIPLTFLALVAGALVLVNVGKGASGGDPPDPRAAVGRAIAPLPLNMAGKNRDQVGVGSYLLNAIGACNSCHSVQEFTIGHNPFLGQPKKVNQATYMTGGVSFGNYVSPNLRPELETGLPGGLTLQQFVSGLKHGTDFEHPGQLQQVSPWPAFRFMTNDDLMAIYVYLSALPPVLPGH